MKKIFMYMAMAALTFGFAACSNDGEPSGDNNGTTPPPTQTETVADKVAGDYEGTLSVKVNGADTTPITQLVKAEKAGSDSINLSIADFKFVMGGTTLPIGDLNLTDVKLNEKDGAYAFRHQQTLSIDIFGTGAPMDLPLLVQGTMDGNNMTFDIDIDLTSIGMTVLVNYSGTKKKA